MYLASIQKIDNLLPIDGADKIELAVVLGWQAVVEKGKFKVDDSIVYIQLDTLLPFRQEYSFLERSSPFKEYGPEYNTAIVSGTKYTRLKTAKFKGQLSQGLVFPLSMYSLSESIEVGSDVTKEVGVLKYEKPVHVSLRGKVAGSFPSFINKTDEERVQNITKVLDKFDGFLVYETLKLDGTSGTYYYRVRDDKFGVCSRNVELSDPNSVYFLIAEQLKLKDRLKEFCFEHGFTGIALQGEIVGPRIQDNKQKFSAVSFKAFTMQLIIDNDTHTFIHYGILENFCHAYSIDMVPIIAKYIFDKNIHTKGYYVERATKLKNLAPADMKARLEDHEFEGVVVRVVNEHVAGAPPRGLDRWSFKSVNNTYKD